MPANGTWSLCTQARRGGSELANYEAMTAQLKDKWLHPFFSGDGGSVEYDPVLRTY